MITDFPNKPGGRIYTGYKRKLYQSETTAGGYTVTRVFSTFSRRSTLLSRFMENCTFGISSSLAVLFSKGVDVIYAYSWPLFASAMLAASAWLKGIPLLVSIQDVYPESLVAQGRIAEKSWLVRLLRRIDGWNARRARRLIVISEQFADIYRQSRGLEAGRLAVVPNWKEALDEATPEAIRNFRQKLGVRDGAVLAGYGGNIGAAAGLEQVISAFERTEHGDTRFLIAGDGSRLEECRRLAHNTSNGTVKFYSPWPECETGLVLQSTDFLILPTSGRQSWYSVPSKLVTYMLAGKPVLGIVEPGTATEKTIRESGCGWTMGPGDTPGDILRLARMIDEVASLPKGRLAEMGDAGKSYAIQHFNRERCLPQIVQIIEAAAAER